MANIVGLSSLNRDARGGDSDDDDAQQFYAGGASQRGGGSGLSVIGPDSGGGDRDAVASIIARARQEAQQRGSAGAGSDGPRPGGHVITFYRDGFTVNDGPYRARTDPANRPFLEAIERGVVPRELEGEDQSGPVDISLVDKRQEEYVVPPQPAYVAFSGSGQRMGTTSYDVEAVVAGADAVAAERPVVDTAKPTTTLQIRLHDGTRLRETLNVNHTIRDLHAIIQLNGAGATAYTLLAGFPPRPVSADLSQTIEAAGLKGASVTQKLI